MTDYHPELDTICINLCTPRIPSQARIWMLYKSVSGVHPNSIHEAEY
ncbi:unnamed protein product, partial [Mycena citricolor]